MMRSLCAAVSCCSLGFVALVPAVAAVAGCGEQVDLDVRRAKTCDYSSADIEEQKAQYPTATWTVRQLCKDDERHARGRLLQPAECTTAAGVPGTRYTLYRDGEVVGIACLSADEETQGRRPATDPRPGAQGVREPRLASRPSSSSSRPAARPWSTSTRTSTRPTPRSTSIPVTLVQAKVVVSAEPIAYRWHFGDGTTTTTTSPGAPYPDLDVAHVYETTEKVVVSVDTQYGAASFTVERRSARADPVDHLDQRRGPGPRGRRGAPAARHPLTCGGCGAADAPRDAALARTVQRPDLAAVQGGGAPRGVRGPCGERALRRRGGGVSRGRRPPPGACRRRPSRPTRRGGPGRRTRPAVRRSATRRTPRGRSACCRPRPP